MLGRSGDGDRLAPPRSRGAPDSLLERAEDDRSRDDDMSGQAIAAAEVEPHKALGRRNVL